MVFRFIVLYPVRILASSDSKLYRFAISTAFAITLIKNDFKSMLLLCDIVCMDYIARRGQCRGWTFMFIKYLHGAVGGTPTLCLYPNG